MTHTTSVADRSHEGLRRVGETPALGDYLRDMWRRRDYAVYGAMGDLEAEQRDNVLGNLWHLLSPLLLMTVYWLVFGGVLRTTRGLEGHSFVAFLAAGMLPFQYSQKCFIGGASSIVRNVGILRTLVFPRALLPLARFAAETLAFGGSFVIMMSVVLIFGESPTLRWLLLPAVVLVQGLFNLGGALITARATSHFRDLLNILPYVFRLLIYLSGIFYLVDGYADQHPWIADVFIANPFYSIVTIYRWVLLDLPLSPWAVFSVGAWALALPTLGMAFFLRGEASYGRW